MFLGNQDQIVRICVEVQERDILLYEIRGNAVHNANMVDSGNIFVQVHHMVGTGIILVGDTLKHLIVGGVRVLVEGDLVVPEGLGHDRITFHKFTEMAKVGVPVKSVDVHALVRTKTCGKHLFTQTPHNSIYKQ